MSKVEGLVHVLRLVGLSLLPPSSSNPPPPMQSRTSCNLDGSTSSSKSAGFKNYKQTFIGMDLPHAREQFAKHVMQQSMAARRARALGLLAFAASCPQSRATMYSSEGCDNLEERYRAWVATCRGPRLVQGMKCEACRNADS